MVADLLSTGEVARLCSVTPDTVLKWIKQGKMKAERTRGGHHRVSRCEVERLRQADVSSAVPRCWEYAAEGEGLTEACRQCIVYRSGATWCFHLSEVGCDIGHSRRFCQNTCEDCEYYSFLMAQRVDVLLFTEDPALIVACGKEESGSAEIRLHPVETEYALSARVAELRPPFVVIDGALGLERAARLAACLRADERVQFEGIIAAVEGGVAPSACDERIDAWIDRNDLVGALSDTVRQVRAGRSIAPLHLSPRS